MDLMFVLGCVLAYSAIYYGAPDIHDHLGLYLHMDSFVLVLAGKRHKRGKSVNCRFT